MIAHIQAGDALILGLVLTVCTTMGFLTRKPRGWSRGSQNFPLLIVIVCIFMIVFYFYGWGSQ